MVITAARETQSARSNKKITPEFDYGIMIDNDPSLRAMARDTEVSEYRIRQTVHEDIRYFSYEMRKGANRTLRPCHTSRGTPLMAVRQFQRPYHP